MLPLLLRYGGERVSNRIKEIESSSPLSGKVQPGDELLSINGREVTDVLDYMFFSYDPKLTVRLRRGGNEWELEVEKPEGEPLGLVFEDYLMDRARSCTNRCVFCFVDQLPRGMRRSLYFKDDDARLSFLTGSYITLTNLSEREIQRICDMRISPINI